MEIIDVECECAPNIALVKYWGKADEELILPLNGSISITLDREVLCSRTSIKLIKMNQKNNDISINLNNQHQTISLDNHESTKPELISKKRFLNVLTKVYSNCALKNSQYYKIEIISTNNFPTACGLASSASGYACLAICLGNAFKYNGDISELARIGSGSACRSCFGGFVQWSSSMKSEESISKVLFPSNHWEEMNLLVLVVEDKKKDVSSSKGMLETVQTSDLLKQRVKIVEKERLHNMTTFIKEKDFESMAELIIKESNSLHAVCLDTYPPLFYLNEESRDIIRFINEFNSCFDSLKVAYSFDAGPNCFLFFLDEQMNALLYFIYLVFYESTGENESNFIDKILHNKKRLSFEIEFKTINPNLKDELWNRSEKIKVNRDFINHSPFKYIIHSKVGTDPSIKSSLYRF
jgi:diphosphomevalonate decarboxylase